MNCAPEFDILLHVSKVFLLNGWRSWLGVMVGGHATQLLKVFLLPDFFHLSIDLNMDCNCSYNLSTLYPGLPRATTLPISSNFCSISHNPCSTLPCGSMRTILFLDSITHQDLLVSLSTSPTPFATDQVGIGGPQQQSCLKEQVTHLLQGEKVSAQKILWTPYSIPHLPARFPAAWAAPPDPVISLHPHPKA